MRFAILEDSRSQAALLKAMVEELGHEGVVFPTAQTFRDGLAAQGPFDLLLMDWILPDGSGDELLAWVRERFGWSLPHVNHVFQPGHRIMVQVQSSLFPLYDRNPQTWVPSIFDAPPSAYRKATQTVKWGGADASAVYLPVVAD